MDIKDKKFNMPEDLTHVEEHPTMPEGMAEKGVVMPNMLLGQWINVNPGTRNLVRLVLEQTGTFHVHAYGACTPTPCDWGQQPGIVYATNVTARPGIAFSVMFPAGFKDTIVVGHMDNRNLLNVETFNHFKDGSGRSDYYTSELFRRG